jgi:hypothetical protein
MGAPSIVFWFKDFQLTQNAGGALPDRFQNGHRYTSLDGLATSVDISVPNGASGCSQPKADSCQEGSRTPSTCMSGGELPLAASAANIWLSRPSGPSRPKILAGLILGQLFRKQVIHCTICNGPLW